MTTGLISSPPVKGEMRWSTLLATWLVLFGSLLSWLPGAATRAYGDRQEPEGLIAPIIHTALTPPSPARQGKDRTWIGSASALDRGESRTLPGTAAWRRRLRGAPSSRREWSLQRCDLSEHLAVEVCQWQRHLWDKRENKKKKTRRNSRKKSREN